MLNSSNVATEGIDVAHILANVELDSSFGFERIAQRIAHDLLAIEGALQSKISVVTRELLFFHTITKAYEDPKQPVPSREVVGRKAKLLYNINKLLQTINEVSDGYTACKETYRQIGPVLRMGGYRSLCICFLESLDVISTRVKRIQAHPLALSRGQKL